LCIAGAERRAGKGTAAPSRGWLQFPSPPSAPVIELKVHIIPSAPVIELKVHIIHSAPVIELKVHINDQHTNFQFGKLYRMT
jgi:hypothetical protein